MSLDLFTPTPPTDQPLVDYEREIPRRAQLLEAFEQDEGLQQFELERCKADPWHWFTNYLWVQRPDLVDVCGMAEVPFLGWPKHHELMKVILGLDGWRNQSGRLRNLIVKKSRDTGMSVLVCGCITYDFCFTPGSTSIIMSLRQGAVDSGKPDQFDVTLFGKIRFFLEHLPCWMRPSPWVPAKQARRFGRRRRAGKPRLFDAVLSLSNPDNGASIVGTSTTANGLRSGRARHVLVDEADSIPFLHALLKAASKVGAIRMITSITDDDTQFADVWHGNTGLVFDDAPNSAGWVKRTVMYTDRPELNPNTPLGRAHIAEMRDSMAPADWQTEMECEFRKVASGSIWGPYIAEDAVLDERDAAKWMRAAQRKGIVFVEGWDYGENKALSAWVLAAIQPDEAVALFLDYREWGEEATAEDIARDVAEAGWGPNNRPAYSFGDGAGGAKKKRNEDDEFKRSWLRSMERVGIETTPLNVRSARVLHDKVAAWFREGRVRFHPACVSKLPGHPRWPALWDAVKRYRREDGGKSVEDSTRVRFHTRKDINSHLAEAAAYALVGAEREVLGG